MLDAKEAEQQTPAKKKGKKGKKGGEEVSVIDAYLQKKDDLEFRTLQELNKQMTNWVETLQSQSFGNRSDLEERLYEDVIFSEDEMANSQQELASEFLSEKESEFDFETMAPKPKKQVSPPREPRDARDYKASQHGSKRAVRQ